MTPQELHTLLRRLAGHLHHLQKELEDSSIQTTRFSQTDSHQSHGGPRPPCDLADIDYLTDTGAEQIIKGWANNLATDTPARGLPHGKPLATWCAWLNRHRQLLLDQDWADDAVSELQELETTLRHHIHPQDPYLQVEHRQTARSICRRLATMGHHITPATLRGWARYGHITAVQVEHGRNGYLLSEVLDHLTKDQAC